MTRFPLPTAGSNPQGIVAGQDGALWFTQSGAGKIGRIAVDGTITEFTPPTANTKPLGITAGPDGALWFTESGANQIGRITTAGAITEFLLPTANARPGSIAAGSDGALWFTESGANQVGRITVTGTITEFPTTFAPVAVPAPAAIAAGPDGNLYVAAQFFVSSIGSGEIFARMTTAGSATALNVLALASSAQSMTVGPDGALWFGARGINYVGRLGLDGDFTPFFPPSASSRPAGIAVGPDGALWFADTGTGNIGWFTTGGLVTAIPGGDANSAPVAIATGPDGALWFTDPGTNSIGRLVPPPPLPSSIVAAVLPSSRSVQVGSTATAFATVINVRPEPVSGCAIVPVDSVPAAFLYQTTDPVTNAPVGTPNTPVPIGAGRAQTFLVAFTVNAPFVPMSVRLGFSCANLDAAVIAPGVNTLLLSGSASPVPDVIVESVTPSGDGILRIAGASGANAFAIATFNVGAAASITVAPHAGAATLPLTLAICQTNSGTGQCLTAPAQSVALTIDPNATPTFAIFATASGSIPFDPTNSRISVDFRDPGGAVRGSSSVAVKTE